MKKYFNLLMVALFATMTLSFASCSDDDEPDYNDSDSNLCGKITAQYEGGSTIEYFVYEAIWDGNDFNAVPSLSTPAEVKDNIFGIFERTISWHIKLEDEQNLTPGKLLDIDYTSWNDKSGNNTGYSCKKCSGNVKVTSVNNNDITLQFENFKFNIVKIFNPGESTFQNVVVNGKITFHVEI